MEARRKARTKKVALKSDFHAHGSVISLWPKRLTQWHHQQLLKLAPSRFLVQGKSALKVCEHNRAARASMAHDKGHLQKTQGGPKPPSRWVKSWGAGMDNMRRVKKQQKEERKRRQGSTYWRQIKHDTHVIWLGWTLDINWQDSSKRREWAIQRLRGRKVM